MNNDDLNIFADDITFWSKNYINYLSFSFLVSVFTCMHIKAYSRLTELTLFIAAGQLLCSILGIPHFQLQAFRMLIAFVNIQKFDNFSSQLKSII